MNRLGTMHRPFRRSSPVRTTLSSRISTNCAKPILRRRPASRERHPAGKTIADPLSTSLDAHVFLASDRPGSMKHQGTGIPPDPRSTPLFSSTDARLVVGSFPDSASPPARWIAGHLGYHSVRRLSNPPGDIRELLSGRTWVPPGGGFSQADGPSPPSFGHDSAGVCREDWVGLMPVRKGRRRDAARSGAGGAIPFRGHRCGRAAEVTANESRKNERKALRP